MEPINQIKYDAVDYRKQVLYMFDNSVEGGMAMMAKTENSITKMWQVTSCFIASLSCIPFGLMLGWPCPTYPNLLKENEKPHIVITWDQSAMIAGFLMLGNTLGTPLSSTTLIPTKYGLLLGVFIMLIGGCFMWLASDIFWLLGSRFCVGFGHGFSLGQLRSYINEIVEEENLKIIIMKQISLHAPFGIALMVSFGSFLDFETNAIIMTIISATILFCMLFLPQISDPKEKSVKHEKLFFCKCSIKEFPLLQIFRDKKLRNNFLILFTLVLCQQYSGVPATIIYCQIMFEKFHSPLPKFFAIAYTAMYFFLNILGVFVSTKYNKRSVLLLSSLGVSVVIIVEIVISFVDINKIYWTYTSIAVIYLYLIIHTLGLGNIPFTLISDFFPKQYRNSIIHFYVMFHSMLALTITKIFQVIITNFHISIAFCLFLCFSLTGFIFTYFVLSSKTEKAYVVNQTKK